ncbi:MAG: sporulation integral membrane protein YtvI [Lachnospiraceae bacterium]
MREYLRIIINILLPFVVIGLIVVLGWKLLLFFMPFAIGWLIAVIANPFVKFLEKKIKMARKHGSILLVIGVLAVTILAMYSCISWVVRELISFVRDLPSLLEAAQIEFNQILVRITPAFDLLPDALQMRINDLFANFGTIATDFVSQISLPTIEIAGDVVSRIPAIFVNVIVTILCSYFFLVDRDKISNQVKKWIPKPILHYSEILLNKIKILVSGYFMAQFRIMFVVFILLTIGYGILGVSYYGLVAFLTAFLDMLPVFGTGTILIPWAVLKVLAGEYYVAGGLVILYLVTQGVRQIIQPKIVGDTMGLNPLATLFFMYLGFKFSGIAGMILAVPIGLIFIELWRIGIFDQSVANAKLLEQKIQNFLREKNE